MADEQQSEVIRAIELRPEVIKAVEQQSEVIRAITTASEVIGAISSEDSPCIWGSVDGAAMHPSTHPRDRWEVPCPTAPAGVEPQVGACGARQHPRVRDLGIGGEGAQ